MAQLILLLVYIVIIAAIVWQVVILVRDPTSRSSARMLFVAVAGALIAGVVYFGVLH